MKCFLPALVLLMLCTVQSGFAQPFSIKGRITDTLNANVLQYSSVTLIRAADSILETYTRSRQDGSFELQTPNAGQYLVMITFPSFADYIDIVTVDSSRPVVDMGTIPMVSKSHLLSEFVLKQQIGAIKIKGDTLEYVADSFKVRDNATVEELLKKLPGIQVSKSGEVVAQGEKVQKILVDGEEFFTDDPAVVTKSLQAKAVDKVQVFDKKSDQAEFTGIDDGIREKTINLQLKDNMKRGFFGKAIAGGGTDGFFENQGMVNAFKGKRKLAAFGIVANTGRMGMGWQDREKYSGGNSNAEYTEDGFMMTYRSNDEDEFVEWDGTYTGQGLPSAWTGGIHYSNKWNQDKLHLSNNYRYGKNNIEIIGNTLTQYNLDSAQYYTRQRNQSFRTGERHRIDGLFEWKFDSTSSLKVTANAGYSDTRSYTDYNTQSVDTGGRVFNTNSRRINSEMAAKSLNSTLAYRKKFQKKGRTFSLTMDQKFRETTGESFLHSISDLYVDTAQQFFDQRKTNDSRNLQFSGNASYTEPLSKVLFIEVNYGLGLNNSFANRISYNPNGVDGTFDVPDSIFSSKYDFNVLTNTGGSNLRLVFKKTTLSVGGAVAATRFEQIDRFGSTGTRTRNYNNFFPRMTFTFRPAQQKSVYFNYNGSTRQPSMEQIQPLAQNTDPLNIAIGNERLDQEFRHNFNLRYNNYKVFSGTYTYLATGFTTTDDAISRSETIDTNRVRRYQYVNVDGNYNGWLWGGWGRQIRKLDLRVGFWANANMGRYINYINGLRNESHNNSFSLSLDFNYDKEKKCNLHLQPRITYFNNTASVNNTTTNYFTYTLDFDGSVQLPHKFELGTEVTWNVREKVAAFDNNNNVLLWNAYLSRKFLKGDNLELRAYVNDILNQNIGFERSGFGNTVTQQDYNTIRRYGMLSLIWNFTRTAAPPKAEETAETLQQKLD